MDTVSAGAVNNSCTGAAKPTALNKQPRKRLTALDMISDKVGFFILINKIILLIIVYLTNDFKRKPHIQ
jgi:hypothetical protein